MKEHKAKIISKVYRQTYVFDTSQYMDYPHESYPEIDTVSIGYDLEDTLSLVIPGVPSQAGSEIFIEPYHGYFKIKKMIYSTTGEYLYYIDRESKVVDNAESLKEKEVYDTHYINIDKIVKIGKDLYKDLDESDVRLLYYTISDIEYSIKHNDEYLYVRYQYLDVLDNNLDVLENYLNIKLSFNKSTKVIKQVHLEEFKKVEAIDYSDNFKETKKASLADRFKYLFTGEIK